MSPTIQVPNKLPGMILPSCNLIPHNGLPLYIFEQRYRIMLEEVLRTSRLFFIVQSREATDPAHHELGEAHEYGAVGMVRACMENDDGTSHLLLHGLQRIRLKRIDSSAHYPLADIELVEAENEGSEVALASQRALVSRIQALADASPVAMDLLESVSAPKANTICADILAARLLPDPDSRREFLSLRCVEKRYQKLEALVEQYNWDS